jgi:hypothetical protein
MGTRSLICVVSDGKYKIAQHNGCDGMPSGNGCDVLKFCHKMENKNKWDKFNRKLDSIIKFSSEDVCTDFGPEILNMVYKAKASMSLQDCYEFAGSIHCEWAYVIDLDKYTLEVYYGHKTKLTSDQRFFKLQVHEKYYPIKLQAKFNLNDLPDYDVFENECYKGL